MTIALDASLFADLAAGRYEFIDAGCASGRSIDHCSRRFRRGPGLGLDWYGADLELARRQGFAVGHCDLTSVEFPLRCVSYVSMVDVLEHLPDPAAARRVLASCGRAARDFLFIRHPSFEDIEFLRDLGLKTTWTDWPTHTNMMRIAEFERIFAELGWTDYVILPHLPLLDSWHPAIVPMSAPADTQAYDGEVHAKKGRFPFDRPIYGKFDLFVRLNPDLDEASWADITTLDGWRAVWEFAPAAPRQIGDSAGELRRLAADVASAPHRGEPRGRHDGPGRLAQVFDPWLARAGSPLPDIPPFLEDYLDDHLVQCLKWKDYFFLRLAHLMDAVGRIPEPIADVLSVGAGMGYQEAFLAGRLPSLRVLATDHVLRNPEFPMPNLRFEPLDLLADPGGDRYDLVYSIECLEHIQDYRRAFRHKAARVKPGKYFYVSVPFASPAQQQDPDLCQRAWEIAEHVIPGFSFEDLQELFDENGLEVLHASNMFHLDVVLPVRHIVDRLSAAELKTGGEALANLLLHDLQDRRVSVSTESEGIRFLGRKVR